MPLLTFECRPTPPQTSGNADNHAMTLNLTQSLCEGNDRRKAKTIESGDHFNCRPRVARPRPGGWGLFSGNGRVSLHAELEAQAAVDA